MAKIIIWENWNCLFTIENAKGIAYPKGTGTPGPPTHISCYILKIGGQDYELEEFGLFVYH